MKNIARLLFFFFCYTPMWLSAQNWQWSQATRGSGEASLCKAVFTADGGQVQAMYFTDTIQVGGQQVASLGDRDVLITKTDSAGHLIWHFWAGGAQREMPTDLSADTYGNIFVSGVFTDSIALADTVFTTMGVWDAFLLKINPAGQLVWAKQLGGPGDQKLQTVATDPNGNIIVGGLTNNFIRLNGTDKVAGGDDDLFIAKYSGNGQHIWSHVYGGVNHDAAHKVATDALGNVLVSGIFQYNTNFGGQGLFSNGLSRDVFLAKYTPGGNLLWVRQVKTSSDASPAQITVDRHGGVWLVGAFSQMASVEVSVAGATISSFSTMSFNQPANKYYLIKFDSVGAPFGIAGPGSGTIPICYGAQLHIGQIATDSANNNLLLPVTTSDSVFVALGANNGLFANLSTGRFATPGGGQVLGLPGSLVWPSGPYQPVLAEVGTPGLGSIELKTVSMLRRGRLMLGGNYQHGVSLLPLPPLPQSSTTQAFWATTGGYKVQATGRLFLDVNKNCLPDSAEPGLGHHLLQAQPNGNILVTNANGHFKYQSGYVGKHMLRPVLPNLPGLPYDTTQCPTAVQLWAGNQWADTNGINMAIQAPQCAYLTVNVQTNRLRRCMRTHTVVNYNNRGTVAAHAAQIKVVLPAFVKAIDASVPYTANGQTLTFNVGTIAAGASGVIVITDSVVCGNESIRGLTQCIKATIFPPNVCNTHPLWSGAQTYVHGSCLIKSDSVRFTIKNIGTGAMTDSAQARVFVSNTQQYAINYQLAQGDSMWVALPAMPDSTYRLEADQPAHYPGGGYALHYLSPCKGTPPGHALVYRAPTNTPTPYQHTTCLPIVDSYDPNDKLVRPAGLGPLAYTPPGQRLYYTIRFQNTGTDTAYRVVITDTLHPLTNMATLQMGAASHGYSVDLRNRLLQFSFNNINLPDSGTNQLASNGFVQYSIMPTTGAALGSAITNLANIYFDYNSPIRTNTTLNTLQLPTHGSGFLANNVVVTYYNTITGLLPQATGAISKVFPNPCTGGYISVASNRPFTHFRLLNAHGQTVLSGPMPPNNKINVGQLPKATYWLRLTHHQQGAQVHKVVVW